MNDASFKPSLRLESLLGPDVAIDAEGFTLFIKAYYEWLQSTKVTLTDVSGTFVRGEQIVGQTSSAKAIIQEVGDGYLVLRVTTRVVFNNSEVITGQTSSATATIVTIKDNVVRESGNLINYRNIDTSIDQYVEYLRDELYHNIPLRYYGDKKLIATQFRSFFESRSNEDSYRFLFKLLYNENIDFYYPGEDILRVSDGNYEKLQVIRVTAAAYGTNDLGQTYQRNIFDFLNQTIEGQTSGFLANVVDIKKFFVGSTEIAELTLKLVSGVFVGGETITSVNDANLNATTYGVVSGFVINDGGSGYTVGNEINISGDGFGASARVSSIKESPISALAVDAIGYGYRLGTLATIDNTGTGGSGLIVKVSEIEEPYTVTSGNTSYTVGEISKVSVVSRGENYFKTPVITLQDQTIASLGLLTPKLIQIQNAGTNYGVGNSLIFTGGSGTNAAGIVASVNETTTYDFLFEDGDRLVIESSYEDILKNEDWNVLGPISRIEITNFGTGYTNESLPTITVNTTTGSSANLIVTGIQGTSANVIVDVANNIAGIGSIRALEITNIGINYTTATANASSSGDGNANLTPIITGLATREGSWVDDDGKINYKFIQDSYFYQDFSYVIKSGLGFDFYRDTLKRIIHPAGLQLFGEILIRDSVDVTPDIVTDIEIFRNFERLLVEIVSWFTVGAEYEYSRITWTVKIEADEIVVANETPERHEYVIKLVPGGDDITSVSGMDDDVLGFGDITKIFSLTGYKSLLNSDRPISEYANTVIDSVDDDAFDIFYKEIEAPYISLFPSPMLTGQAESKRTSTDVFRTEMNVEVAPDATNMYKFIFGDETIGEIGGMTIGGNTLNAIYEGQTEGYENYTFNSVLRDFPKTFTEVIKKFDTNEAAHSVALPMSKEYVNQYYSRGFGYEIFDEVTLATYANTSISTFAETACEQYHADVDDISIPMFLSPLSYGQSEGAEDPRDIFHREFNVEIFTFLDAAVSIEPYIISNEMATTDDIELDREIPILITFNIPINVHKEYNVVVSPTPSFLDVSTVFSSVLPQKFQSAEGIVSAYGITLEGLTFLEYGNEKLNGLLGESRYQGTNTSYGDSAFTNYYRTYPHSDTEMIQRIITVESDIVDVHKEIIVSYPSGGPKPIAYFDTEIANFASDTFADRGNEHFELYFDTVQSDIISVFPSPLLTGQAITSKDVTDIFRTEMVQQVKTITPVTSQINSETYLAEVGDKTFNDFSPETENYGNSLTYSENTFNDYFRTFAKVNTEMVRQIPAFDDASAPDNHDRQIVVSYLATGFRFRLLAEMTFADEGETLISVFADRPLNEILDSAYDNTIKASPSPMLSGASGNIRLKEDIFQNEIIVKPNTNVNPYNTQFEDLVIDILDELTFETLVPGTGVLLGNQALDAEYQQAPLTLSNYIRYGKTTGTVSSLAVNITEVTLDDYSETPLEFVDEDTFGDTVPFVVGTGSNFTSDYDIYDVFAANNEYFIVEAVANNTHMIVDRHPMASYSGVYGYKQTI